MMSAPSGGDAARALLADSTLVSAPLRTDTTVVFSPDAIEVLREAEQLIADAHLWAENLTNLVDGEDMDVPTLDARRELVHKMRASFYTNLVRLIAMAQGFDGHEIRFHRDGEACLYWRHPKSGYCGGLILHRNLRYSKAGEPIVVGDWSVHT